MAAAQTVLLSITALARAGALAQAWRVFRESGLDGVDDDPAVLSVRGRLLKDEARGAKGLQQQRLYRQAAEAYARAAELSGQTYPLINAATLALLAGQPRKSRTLARAILARPDDDAETPYWRCATRAEALLLLGNVQEARQALAGAMRLAPQAFEDHASTLRQFALILAFRHEDASWLDDFRPPRRLHFAGPMTLARGESALLRQKIDAVLREERAGAAYGALAAGADILIAEALLEKSAALHVVLPCAAPQFRQNSVARYGGSWPGRFDRVIEAASSIRVVAEEPGAPFPLAIRLAGEIAMGLAAMDAELLQAETVQLVLLPEGRSDAGSSAWMADCWNGSGRRQRILHTRSSGRAAKPPSRANPQICLAAMLRVEFPGLPSAETNDRLRRLAAALSHIGVPPLVAPRWTGEAVTAGFRTAADAAAAIAAFAGKPGIGSDVRVAAHYGMAHRLRDPFSRTHYLASHSADAIAEIAAVAPAGAIYATEDYAAALHATSRAAHTEHVGDLPGPQAGRPIRLFSVKP